MTGSGAAAAVDETARPATTALTRPRSHLRMKAILPIPRTALPRRAVTGHSTVSPTRRRDGQNGPTGRRLRRYIHRPPASPPPIRPAPAPRRAAVRRTVPVRPHRGHAGPRRTRTGSVGRAAPGPGADVRAGHRHLGDLRELRGAARLVAASPAAGLRHAGQRPGRGGG